MKGSFFRYIPIFKGKLRLSRIFYRKNESFSKPHFIPVKYGLQFCIPSLNDSVGYELFINGIYEKKLVQYLIENIPANGTYIDVGANIGSIALLVAKKRPDIKIIAFEASPLIFKYLLKNKELNQLENVVLVNKAIHKDDGATLTFYSSENHFGQGSFSKENGGSSETVQCIRLDSFFLQHGIIPDIIKVDVQGYELLVFEGMENYFLTNNKKPVILFEFEEWAEEFAFGKTGIGSAQQKLIDYGYRIADFAYYKKEGNYIKPVTKGSRELIGMP